MVLAIIFTVVCSPYSQVLRLHPSLSPITDSAEVFYSEILPTWKGKKVMLVTNPSGIGMEPHRIKEEFQKYQVTLSHIMGLEHGFLGLEEEFSKNPVSIDNFFQAPIYHVYKLQKKELQNLVRETDIVLIDVQGMGMRVYTYATVLKRLMDVSSGKELFYIIDHITPTMYLGGRGDFLDPGFENFAGEFPSPMFTGMTLGEEARFYNGEYLKNKVSLQVLPVKGYKRGMLWESTGIPWHTPSPNLPLLENARNYLGLVFLEGVNVSVGRGTTAPFVYFGAPWMESPRKLARAMQEVSRNKYYFTPVFFKPNFGPHTGKICHGLRMHLVDPSYDPIELAYHLILNMKKLYPENFQWTKWSKIYPIDYLWGSPRFRENIEMGTAYPVFYKTFQAKEKDFDTKARKYYLY